MSIEEVAKRVRLLQMTYVLYQEVAIYRDEIARLAPQLAEWVEKALPVIEAAIVMRALSGQVPMCQQRDPVNCEWCRMRVLDDAIEATGYGWRERNEVRDRFLRALDTTTSSSLAAEGTTE